MNYKVLTAISLDFAAMRIQLAEVEDYLTDEIFTDITESEILAITKSAYNVYNKNEYTSMKEAAEFVTTSIVDYLSELGIESISVKDLLELMSYDGLI